jgi:hypothetical protein
MTGWVMGSPSQVSTDHGQPDGFQGSAETRRASPWNSAGVARTWFLGPRHVPGGQGKAADLKNRSALPFLGPAPSKSNGVVRDPSPALLRRAPSPLGEGCDSDFLPSPLGRGGTARRGVRGFFAGDAFIAMEVSGPCDFDATLPSSARVSAYHGQPDGFQCSE